jgi:hypothetical protein
VDLSFAFSGWILFGWLWRKTLSMRRKTQTAKVKDSFTYIDLGHKDRLISSKVIISCTIKFVMVNKIGGIVGTVFYGLKMQAKLRLSFL